MLAAAFTLLPGAALVARRARLLARRAAGGAGRRRTGSRWDAGRRRWCGAARGRSSSSSSPALVVLALGNLSHHGTIGFGQGETQPTNSSRGTEVLERTLPARARLAADRGRQGRRGGAR